jgi:hypothetical protein
MATGPQRDPSGVGFYEHPLVLSQLTHLLQLPLGTMSMPQVEHEGPSPVVVLRLPGGMDSASFVFADGALVPVGSAVSCSLSESSSSATWLWPV